MAGTGESSTTSASVLAQVLYMAVLELRSAISDERSDATIGRASKGLLDLDLDLLALESWGLEAGFGSSRVTTHHCSIVALSVAVGEWCGLSSALWLLDFVVVSQ